MLSNDEQFRNAIAFFNSLVDHEKTGICFGVDAEESFTAFRSWLDGLGRPQNGFRSVLIAGTKGKGSTAAILESIARAAGLRVGLYTSPHLESYLERIAVDRRPIPKSAFVRILGNLRKEMEARNDIIPGRSTPTVYGRSTVFELLTAMAFSYFAERRVDLAVIEVGMGGRLDATNAVDPLISVITPISLDHTQVLGKTVGEIAKEKAGIIRGGGVVVTGPQSPEADAVLNSVCRERGARQIISGRTVSIRTEGSPGRRLLSLEGQKIFVDKVRFRMTGRHQAENAATALAVAEELIGKGYPIDSLAVRRGLEKTRWPGRFEAVGREPTIILDGAHNAESFSRLVQTLDEECPRHPIVFVLGLAKDKDLYACLAAIGPAASVLIATQFHSPRARSAQEIGEAARAHMNRVMIEESPDRALDVALRTAGDKDVICVTGSLYLVGELRRKILDRCGRHRL